MHFDLPDDTELLQRTVRDFADSEVAPVAEELDRTKAFPLRARAQDGRARAGWGSRSPRRSAAPAARAAVRGRRRGAHARRLVGRDHAVRAHLARHAADLPVRHRRAEGAAAAGPLRGRKLGAFGLTEPEAGSDAGNVKTRRELDDGELGRSTAPSSSSPTPAPRSRGHVAITARHRRRTEISNLIVENGTPGYEQGEPYRKMGWNASDTRPLTFADCRVPEENLLGPRGAGLQAVPAHPRHRPDRRRGDGRRARAGRARRGARLRQGAQGVRPVDQQVPGDPGQARRHGDRDRGRAPADLQGRVGEGRRAATSR